MLPALYLLFLDLGYLSQLSSGYDFYVFSYGNLLNPTNNGSKWPGYNAVYSIGKIKGVVWTDLKYSGQLQSKVSIHSNWN